MTGTLRVTAILVNPDGVWADDIPVQAPDGHEKTVMIQFLASLQGLGLVRDLGENELECIPMLRVKNIQMKLETNKVSLLSPNDPAMLARAKSALKIQ